MDMSIETSVCPACGAAVPLNALLCPSCGKPNISSAFALPSDSTYFSAAGTATAPGLPADVSAAPRYTSAYRTTEIPKTVLPWEQPASVPERGQAQTGEAATPQVPARMPQTARPGGQPSAQQGTGAASESEINQALLPNPPRTIDELRAIKMVGAEVPAILTQPPPGGTFQQPPSLATPNTFQSQPVAGWATSRSPHEHYYPPQEMRHVPVSYAADQPTSRDYYAPLPAQVTRPGLDRRRAARLEYLGYVGLLGIGHIYAGYAARGLLLFLVWVVVFEVLVQLLLSNQGWWLLIPALLVPVVSSRWVAWSLGKSGIPSK